MRYWRAAAESCRVRGVSASSDWALTFLRLEGVWSTATRMFIQELARLTGVSTKTIRYYESIGLLPPPQRAANQYREYARAAVDRLRVIASARRLGFGLADIGELLSARDNEGLLCSRVVGLLDRRLAEIDQRVADLLATRDSLDQIRRQGLALPQGHTCDGECVEYFTTDHGEQSR